MAIWADMPEPLPPRPDRPLAITRAHLFALAALSIAMAVLAFFVGVQLGRREAVVEPAPAGTTAIAPLVGEDVRSGDLEVLLTRVEAAQGASLTFPSVLPRSELPVASDGVPTDGWAIEVASRRTAGEAQQLVETLRAADLAAYRLAVLVDGKPEHRVRIGGYGSEASAVAAIPEVKSRAGADHASVAPAP